MNESGLRRFLLWCIRVSPSVSLLPVLVTWLLPVAGTTYKPAVIKVFDLLSLPAETHISRPANTTLLPLWSMTEGEARGTNWQCRDWTRGCGDGEGGWQGREEGRRKLAKSEWDRGEVRADEIILGMYRLYAGLHIWRNIKFSLLVLQEAAGVSHSSLNKRTNSLTLKIPIQHKSSVRLGKITF